MIKGKVELITNYGTPDEEVVYADNNMIVDGAGELISLMMTLPPDGETISSASALYDVSNFTVKAVSFGKAPLHYYYNAHKNEGAAKFGREASGQVWVSATYVSGASSYTPTYYLPNAPIPTDQYLVNFNNVIIPDDVKNTIVQTILSYITTSGFVLGWGEYSTYPDYSLPQNLKQVSAISAGFKHFVALTSGGQVSCWGGQNSFGELTKPSLPACSAVGASRRSSFAISQAGNLYSWGFNGGLLNYPSTYSSGLSGIAGGNSFFVILKNDGTVSSWGSSGYTPKPIPAQIQGITKKVVSNWPSYHTVALLNNGSAVSWIVDSGVVGGANQGQTNISPLESSAVTLTKLGGSSRFAHDASLGGNNNFGYYFGIKNGSALGWGESTSPLTLLPFTFSSLTDIKTNGRELAVSLKNDGTVSGWGYGPGANSVLAFSSVGLSNIRSFDVDYDRVKFVTNTNQVSGYGVFSSSIPTGIQGNVSSLDLTRNYTTYLTTGGNVSTFMEWSGIGVQITPPLYISHASVKPPTSLQGSCTNISVNQYQSFQPTSVYLPHRLDFLGLRTDGTVFKWGGFGSYVPTGLSGVSSIVLATDGKCAALKSNGVVSAWQSNGTQGTQITVPSSLQSSCIQISVFKDLILGLRSDGEIIKITSSNNIVATLPSATYDISPLTSVIDAATGAFHTLILNSSGIVSAFGRNVEGQCNVPEFIQGHAIKVAAGEYQSFVVLDDGQIYGWGLNATNPGGLLSIPNDDTSSTNFYNLVVNDRNAVGLYSSSVPYYATETETEGESFFNSKNYKQNINVIPFKDTIINKINALGNTVDIIPSTIGGLLEGAYPPSGGITVRIVSGTEPYITVASASLSGTFNRVGSMDFRGYVNVTSGTNPLSGLVTSSLNVSSNGQVVYIITIAAGDCAFANVYGGITQMGLWAYDLEENVNLGFTPPYSFRRYPEETGSYIEPLKYKLFAKKVFNENILKIRDFGTTNAGLTNHQNLTIRWRLYFL